MLVWKVLHSKQQIQAEKDTLKINKERLSRTPAWFLLKSKQSDFLPTRIQFRSYLIKLIDNLEVENLYVEKHQNYHMCFVSCTVTKKQGCLFTVSTRGILLPDTMKVILKAWTLILKSQ